MVDWPQAKGSMCALQQDALNMKGKKIWIRQMGLAPSSEASTVGFHFPGGSLTLSSFLIPYLQLWTWQWDFKGRLLNEAIPSFWLELQYPILYWFVVNDFWKKLGFAELGWSHPLFAPSITTPWSSSSPLYRGHSIIMMTKMTLNIAMSDDQDDDEYGNRWWWYLDLLPPF